MSKQKTDKPRKRAPRKGEGRPPVITDEWRAGTGLQMIVWFQDETNLWLKDFAKTIKSPITDRPYSWTGLLSICQENAEFSEALKICHDIQESRLFHIGLETKSAMPIFALKNVSNWRDKQEIEHSGEGFTLRIESKE